VQQEKEKVQNENQIEQNKANRETNQLEEYMLSVLQEPFGKNSARLQRYVTSKISERQERTPLSKSSHSRLGFSSEHYSTIDLTANNETISVHGKGLQLDATSL
jgi:hypothetical protein